MPKEDRMRQTKVDVNEGTFAAIGRGLPISRVNYFWLPKNTAQTIEETPARKIPFPVTRHVSRNERNDWCRIRCIFRHARNLAVAQNQKM